MKISVRAAEELAATALRSVGVPHDAAETSARLLVAADIWGIGSHGLMRLPRYLARLMAGGVRADAAPVVLHDVGAAVAYDGRGGLGHPQMWLAAEAAVNRAARFGIGMASVGDSSHCGALGLYTATAIKSGLVGIAVSTGPAVMAPPGTSIPILSTSPIAAGIPDGRGGYAIVDLATTAVARGRIAAAARREESIPYGWALDAFGQPTTDPGAALTGMLAPLGGPKGFALAYMVEALSAGLVGPELATGVPDMFNPEQDGDPQRISHLVMAIDPAVIDIDGHSADRLGRLNENIVRVGGRVPGARRTLPGDADPESLVDISDEVIAELRSRPSKAEQLVSSKEGE